MFQLQQLAITVNAVVISTFDDSSCILDRCLALHELFHEPKHLLILLQNLFLNITPEFITITPPGVAKALIDG
jgi:hypothetical protein